MDKFEFACFFNRLQKSLNVYIDSDIVAMIYKEYIRKYYEKHTLWQLSSMLDKNNAYICCKHSKKSIIQMIADSQLDIPCDKHWYDVPEKTEWEVHNMKYIDHLTPTFARHVSANIICINNAGYRTEIMCGDVFYLFENRYSIDIILDDKKLVLICKEDNTKIVMLISEFIQRLDTDENAGIDYNHLRQITHLSKMENQ